MNIDTFHTTSFKQLKGLLKQKEVCQPTRKKMSFIGTNLLWFTGLTIGGTSIQTYSRFTWAYDLWVQSIMVRKGRMFTHQVT